MLKRIGEIIDEPNIKIKDATLPKLFDTGLEYSAPARGTWNIVHTGMLVPEAHQIFVCAQGCLRGVVLTAAEMGLSDRFSTIAVREQNVLDGDMESLIIEGVIDILNKLDTLPPAVLLFTSCVHHFMGTDLDIVFSELRRLFPTVRFTDCYMNPIMRKSGLTPDQLMRRRLYSLLEERDINKKAVSIVGGDFAISKDSELAKLITDSGYKLMQIQDYKYFEDYLEMAESSICISTFPSAKTAGEYLNESFGQAHLYLPFSFDYDEIIDNLRVLANALNVDMPDYSLEITKCDQILATALDLIGDTPIVIDYTAFSRPLSLAKLLIKKGFNVKKVYLDSVTADEVNDFEVLKNISPEMILAPSIHTSMRRINRNLKEKVLAIGQKAAYFTSTEYFVNIVEDGGLYGFDGIIKFAEMLCDSYENAKDVKTLISEKGLGCGGCI